MSNKEKIIKEIEQIPDDHLEEALDFIRYLKTKKLQERLETAIASESSLQKDWLKPEEEAAWQNL